MTKIHLYCRGAMARAQVEGQLTHAMAGIPVELQWDEAWDSLLKTMKIRCADVCRTAIVSEDGKAVVPYECLIAGQRMEIGMDGWSEDGQLRIPSSWASCGIVKPSVAQCEGAEGAPPTVETVAKLQILVGKAEEAYREANQAAGHAAGSADEAAGSAEAAEGSAAEAANAAAAAEELVGNIPDFQVQIDALETGKVSKEAGKGLSTNDYDNAEKETVGALVKEVMAYDQWEAAKYYRIVFDEMWNSKTSSVIYQASIGEVAFYDEAGEEVAIAAAVATSENNTSRKAKYAYDRNESTYWMSVESETDTHMLTFTLERAAVIPRISLMPYVYSTYGVPSAFSVYVSQDGESWQHSVSYTEQRSGWTAKQWRDYDISPYTITEPSLRTEFHSLRDNYEGANGVTLALKAAAKAKIKRLLVTPNSAMPNEANPENILSHGMGAGLEVTDGDGQVTAFTPEQKLICIPAPWSHLTDVTIDGTACAADRCDWSRRRMIRRFASYAFKGRESLKAFGSNPGCFSNYRFTLPVTPTLTGNANSVIGLCTHYPYVPYNNIVNQTSGYGISITANKDGTHTLVIFDQRFSTAQELSAYLTEQNDAGTPVTFYYMLESAVEEELGAEDFALFEQLQLPGGDCTAANPDGCRLELEYWKEFPTRNYGDWLYELLSLKELRAGAGSGSSNGISLKNTVTVEEFGAVGDGLTDDTLAFQAALETGKNVLCLGAEYVISDRLVITEEGQRLTGSGHTTLNFISTDPDKVGIDLASTWSALSKVSLSGSGIGFGVRLRRSNPDVYDAHNQNLVDEVRIINFEEAITATTKSNMARFNSIFINKCKYGLYFPDTHPESTTTEGPVDLIFDSLVIYDTKYPYYMKCVKAAFNALNIGFKEDTTCYTDFGTYVFTNSKYESETNFQGDYMIHMGASTHIYIGHHFAFGSENENAAGFHCQNSCGLVFIGCDHQTNAGITTINHFIDPTSTFRIDKAVYYGPGEHTYARKIPRPKLDDYPENKRFYADYYEEAALPSFDAAADEGKVLKIVDGAAQWVSL